LVQPERLVQLEVAEFRDQQGFLVHKVRREHQVV